MTTISLAQTLGIYDKAIPNEVVADRIIQHVKPEYSWVIVRSFPYNFDNSNNQKDTRAITVGPTHLEGLRHFIQILFLNTHAVNMNRAASAILGSKDPADKISLQNAAQQNYRITLYLSYDGSDLDIQPERVQAFPGAEPTQAVWAWFFSLINPYPASKAPPVSTQSPISPMQISSLPLLSYTYQADSIIDYKTNALDFTISQFKKNNEDWCIKNKNWYEKVPISLKLRILRDIQGGYTPRNETCGPLCEAIRVHLTKTAPSEQKRLIGEEIIRFEKLQRFSPLLIQAEKIYSSFKTTWYSEAQAYAKTLKNIYTLLQQVQNENPKAFKSLQKIASAAGIILNDVQTPPQQPPLAIDTTTETLTRYFIEVLALWIDHNGKVPWGEKPSSLSWLQRTFGMK